jgi:20S proteasome alpha/beta subunit
VLIQPVLFKNSKQIHADARFVVQVLQSNAETQRRRERRGRSKQIHVDARFVIQVLQSNAETQGTQRKK